MEKIVNFEFGTSFDMLWILLLPAAVLVSFYVFNDIFDMRDELRKSGYPNPDKRLRSFREIWKMLFVCVSTYVLKQSLHKITNPYLNRRLAAMNFPDHTQRLERLHDFSLGLWFYGASVCFTYYTFYGNANVTWMLGGSETTIDALNYWPDPRSGELPYIEYFYPIQMGYHLHNLIFHTICRTHKATYIEMFLHHYLTWYLQFFSYFNSYEAFGLTVIMCHDIGDLIMNTAKIVRDLQLMSGWRLDLYYGLVVISWAYPRVIVASLTYLPSA